MNIEQNMDLPASMIDSLLMKVEKPARYTGGELGAIRKPAKETNVRFVFAFPDVYEIGMSCLGLEIIYSLLNAMTGVQCERAFAPAADMESEMREAGVPLFSLESKLPVRTADWLGFTIQHELCYTNVLNMLELSGIPIRSNDRSIDDPLVIAGGPGCYNIEPLAEIFDLVLVGDGEESLPQIIRCYEQSKKNKWQSLDDKQTFLQTICDIPGVYIPGFYTPSYNDEGMLSDITGTNHLAPVTISKAVLQDLDKPEHVQGKLVPLIEVVHDRATVELFRGCSRGCRFCQAGMIYRPVRERSAGRIMQIAQDQLTNTGYEEISLLSLSTSDYSQIEPLVTDLMQYCQSSDVSLSIPSLRLDSFSFKMLEEIQRYKKTGLTFAPEAGSQRLRDSINKSITDEDIYHAVRQAISLGWTSIKLYFMVGLPDERQEDLDGIVEIARQIMSIYYESRGGKKGGRFNVTISVSNFVPKPHTPFQWVAQNDAETFYTKHMYLKEKLKCMKNIKFNYHDNKTSWLEGVLARGDRRLLPAIIRARELGCRFDSWHEHFQYEKWLQAFKDVGIDPDFYACRERAYEEKLPWDIIDTGVTKAFLIRENEAAKAEQQTADCRKQCHDCGVNGRYICHV